MPTARRQVSWDGWPDLQTRRRGDHRSESGRDRAGTKLVGSQARGVCRGELGAATEGVAVGTGARAGVSCASSFPDRERRLLRGGSQSPQVPSAEAARAEPWRRDDGSTALAKTSRRVQQTMKWWQRHCANRRARQATEVVGQTTRERDETFHRASERAATPGKCWRKAVTACVATSARQRQETAPHSCRPTSPEADAKLVTPAMRRLLPT